MKLQLASGNRCKAREFESILRHIHCSLAFEYVESGDIVECGVTYYQNACRKVLSRLRGNGAGDSLSDIVFADDSGLELLDFGGIPGIHSARFEYESAFGKNALIRFLQDRHVTSTPGRFVCWIVAFFPWTPLCFSCSGIINGTVIADSRGSEGFGYDPIFIPDGYDCTFGEMESALKNNISHRAQALKTLWSHIQGSLPPRP